MYLNYLYPEAFYEWERSTWVHHLLLLALVDCTSDWRPVKDMLTQLQTVTQHRHPYKP